MTTYRTVRALSSLHVRAPATEALQEQARALKALLRATYGAGEEVDGATVAWYARIVAYWPVVVEQEPLSPE